MRKDLKYSAGTPFPHCETKDQLKPVLMGESPEINLQQQWSLRSWQLCTEQAECRTVLLVTPGKAFTLPGWVLSPVLPSMGQHRLSIHWTGPLGKSFNKIKMSMKIVPSFGGSQNIFPPHSTQAALGPTHISNADPKPQPTHISQGRCKLCSGKQGDFQKDHMNIQGEQQVCVELPLFQND